MRPRHLLPLLLLLPCLALLAGCAPSPTPAAANDWTAPIAWEIAHATIATPSPAPAPIIPTPTPTPTPSPDTGQAAPPSPMEAHTAPTADKVLPVELAAACPDGRCPLPNIIRPKAQPTTANRRPPVADCPSCHDRPRLIRPRTWAAFRRR
jgi:hypothetical protein